MLVLFRHNARKYAYDTVVGSLTVLSALEYRMLEAIQPPMGPVCPTALRYELAKFDSADVEEAYALLYQKAVDGVIFARENGALCVPDADTDTVRAALSAAAERLTAPVTVTGKDQGAAKEILGAKGLIRN
ncbi:MAG: hypothetical protein IJX39_00995 [Clostridia bacterium]|nr:hypothetical protein [Clostridia bacterium]